MDYMHKAIGKIEAGLAEIEWLQGDSKYEHCHHSCGAVHDGTTLRPCRDYHGTSKDVGSTPTGMEF